MSINRATAGHVHAYYRLFPVYNNTIQRSYDNPRLPVHLIVGGAGCDEMMNASVSAPGVDPAWVATSVTDYYGLGLLDVQNDTALRWRWFESRNGVILDEVHITKRR